MLEQKYFFSTCSNHVCFWSTMSLGLLAQHAEFRHLMVKARQSTLVSEVCKVWEVFYTDFELDGNIDVYSRKTNILSVRMGNSCRRCWNTLFVGSSLHFFVFRFLKESMLFHQLARWVFALTSVGDAEKVWSTSVKQFYKKCLDTSKEHTLSLLFLYPSIAALQLHPILVSHVLFSEPQHYIRFS